MRKNIVRIDHWNWRKSEFFADKNHYLILSILFQTASASTIFSPFWLTVSFILLLCSYLHTYILLYTYLSITCKKQYVINRNLEKIFLSLSAHIRTESSWGLKKLSMRNVIKCHMLMVLCWYRCVAQNKIEKKNFFLPTSQSHICCRWYYNTHIYFVSMTTKKWMAANHLYYLFIDKQIVGNFFGHTITTT